jgi:hypothetical protein
VLIGSSASGSSLRSKHDDHRQVLDDQPADRDAAIHRLEHAHVGQLRGDLDVGDEARRSRPDDDGGHEIAHQRRQAQPYRDEAEHEREAEGGGDLRDQRNGMVHRALRREASLTTSKRGTPGLRPFTPSRSAARGSRW